MNYAKWFAVFLRKLSGWSLLGMMLLTISDVVGSFFGHPVLGVEELVALWASILLAFSLPAAHIAKAHVGVDLLYMKLPPAFQKLNDLFITSISCVLFLLIGWQCYLYAGELRAAKEVTMTLQFPAYLLIFGVAFALLVKSTVIFFEIFSILNPEKQ
jgi:TRAP-type C4-dicarboxylate transport system permease small subunit